MPRIELWLEYASTYSYLTVARVGPMADQHSVEIDWQPFWLHPVRERIGLPPPFPDNSPRERYMWRDLERRAKLRELPYRKPAVYPFNSVQVGRVALIGAREGWCRVFTETVFRLHWTKGLPMTEPANIAAALSAAGQEAERVLTLAAAPETKEAFKQQAERALDRGIFGAPSFLVGDELFWGDDRLEDAIAFATRGR